MNKNSQIVICGAGIAGVSTAYYLSKNCGIHDIILVDENAPLSLTSDHSTECYRNWWPGPNNALVNLMNRSIDLIDSLADQSNNVFNLNRRGYLYLTANRAAIPGMIESAQKVSNYGGGPLRIHQGTFGEHPYIPPEPEGYNNSQIGADIILDPSIVHKHFPGIGQDVEAALHVRRAGWLSAQQLGMYMLQQAKRSGVKFINHRIVDVDKEQEQVTAVRLDNGDRIETRKFVNAAGPFLGIVGQMLGVELPLHNELHLKVAMNDPSGVINRSSPLLIWNDPQRIPWTQAEKEILKEEENLHWLLEQLPAGIHTRPEGGPDSKTILILWEYNKKESPPLYPVPIDEVYAEIVVRGLARMLPGMAEYINKLPRPQIDGGYYTKTRENLPIISELPVKGAYIIGALSGFGIMASCGAGELVSKMIGGEELPKYAQSFSIDRYQDQHYLSEIEAWNDTGQL